MTKQQIDLESFGANAWLIEELYERYLASPDSVDETWRAFFDAGGVAPGDGETRAAGTPETEAQPEAQPEAPPTPQAKPAPAPAPERAEEPAPADEEAVPLRGVQARIVENMEASLSIPTATSVRFVPAKLLEENRRVINQHLAARGRAKVSFTHIIGYAVARALDAVPVMKRAFARVDGQPGVVRHERVHLGLAVDTTRKDGTRTLLVPVIRSADRLNFAGFREAYEELIRKTRESKLSPDDFRGATATLTNPGTIGTVLSVPRLMPGQGVIVGVGRVDYPSEYQGADPAAMAALGVGKIIGLTSTYDHRIIQGAESGEFLAAVEKLLLGESGFYEDIFASLNVPYEPIRWTRDRAALPGIGADGGRVDKQSKVLRLANMYRVRGHLIADLNPLGTDLVRSHAELDPAFHGLTVWDLDREFAADDLPGPPRRTLREIIDMLRDSYCRTVGIEYMHIQEADQKQWIQRRVEGVDTSLSAEDKYRILERLNAAEAFETFLHAKYIGHKRFSLEGAEALIPILDALLDAAADDGVEEVVLGMAHRGRLNVLANTVGKSLSNIFREFEGDIDPESIQGSGDVKYHLGAKGTHKSRSGKDVAITLASNPSHLEAVDPVVEGMVRAAQDVRADGERRRVLPLLLHGDAAFAGQGVVAETLAMSQLPGFTTGGTVHVVINNNIGFTTSAAAGRSSMYATDVAKTVQAPIFHVNADDPEACVRVIRLAYTFQRRFRKDVVVDLVCYRRYGHNEADDPSLTQPLMYAAIETHPSVRKVYVDTLVRRGDFDPADAQTAMDDFRRRLEGSFEETRSSKPPRPKAPEPATDAEVPPHVPTGVERETLDRVAAALMSWPDGFEPHPRLAKQLVRRRDALERDQVDWALAEALAFGSLVLEGTPVRISGQDSRRGTFSQRHAVYVDHRTGAEYMPLSALAEDQAPFRIFDSPLTEYAGMGFEYGYSVVAERTLVGWEAQFGDFVNGGQIIVDQFMVAAEDKWNQLSGLVLLLPHGFEGQGPEHSSARIERFLTLCAEDNIEVAWPTTPAQYFHLLRRQVRLPKRKPLVVLTPKSLLRSQAARSATAELTSGSFEEVLPDPTSLDDGAVRAVQLCSGKIYYELAARRQQEGLNHVAIARVEQLYPFPGKAIQAQLDRYPALEEVRWVQEEPGNMGAWSYMHARLHRILRDRARLSHASRYESASPAAGSATIHEVEQEDLLQRAFAGL